MNKFGDKDIYHRAILKHPELIEEQLNIPKIKRSVDLLIMAINGNLLRIDVSNDSFQLLPYEDNNEEENENNNEDGENVDIAVN